MALWIVVSEGLIACVMM